MFEGIIGNSSIKQELINSVISVKRNENGEIEQSTSQYDGYKLNIEDRDITSKIFQQSFEDRKDISLIDFVDKAINISQHFNSSER